MTSLKNTKKKLEAKKEASLTAAQRIEVLEKTTAAIRQMIEVMANEMDKIQQSQLALAERLDATLKVSSAGQISEKAVDQFVVEKKIKEMADTVEALVKQGALVPADEITENSFVIGKELTKEGEVISARTQASTQSLAQPIREALVGKKKGDLISFEQNELSFMVEEVYSVAKQNSQLENTGA